MVVFALADDLTGALETGAKFAEYGLQSEVVTGLESLNKCESPVLVVDTETRHLRAAQAKARVRQIVERAAHFAPEILYKKTDSTLRGNIAAELAALRELFPAQAITYVPAYPDLGRTVKSGELFVGGKRLHHTEFANDPSHPMRHSKIENILGGVNAMVLDGETNDDVEASLDIILDGPIPHLCAGPAALAAALARHLATGVPPSLPIPKISRCLVVNGSLHPSSIEQIKWGRDYGVFDGQWVCFAEAVEGKGRERALRVGRCVRRMLNSSAFDGLIIFGGDTAFGVHHNLGASPFQPFAEIAIGVPISRSAGLYWVTKAGGFGSPDILGILQKRLT